MIFGKLKLLSRICEEVKFGVILCSALLEMQFDLLLYTPNYFNLFKSISSSMCMIMYFDAVLRYIFVDFHQPNLDLSSFSSLYV